MKPLPYATRADLFLQLYQLESAGLPYDKAMATMSLPAAPARLQTMQALAAKGIDAAKAGEQSGLFTGLEVRLVRAALNAGSPAPTYQRLARYYSQRARQWAVMKSRLAMPAFVLGIALLIQPLPALISGSIGLAGYAWQATWPLLLIVAIVLVLRALAGSVPRRIPIYGPIFVRSNLRDFFESLALMLEAGVPMLEALPVAIETVADRDIRRSLTRARQRIEKRATFAAAMDGVSYLKGSRALPFAQTGEQSGKLPEMLMRHAEMETEAIGHFYEQAAAWIPRVIYALVAIKIMVGIFSSGGVGPRIPKDL